MSIPVSVIIGLIVLFLFVVFLIVAIMHLSKKNADTKTKLTIEIPRLFKVNFEQESHKKHP